jgi:hypothetical protein
VRDEPAPLHREDEVVRRRLLEPPLEHARRLSGCKSAVELDAVEATARILEPAPRRQIVG